MCALQVIKEPSLEYFEVYRFSPVQEEFVNGLERLSLEVGEQRRWDYFYRPDAGELEWVIYKKYKRASKQERKHATEELEAAKRGLAEAEKLLEQAQRGLRNLLSAASGARTLGNLFILAGIVAIGVGVFGLSEREDWGGASILGGIVGFVLGGIIRAGGRVNISDKLSLEEKESQATSDISKYKLRIRTSEHKIAQANLVLSKVGADLKELLNMFPTPPSDQEMQENFAHGLEGLQKVALEECSIVLEEVTNKNGPIVLQDWGYVQGEDVPGYRSLRNAEERHAAFAVSAQGQLLYCTYYIQYIFLTEHKIEVYGTFYDVIADHKSGRLSDTYHYGHVSNLRVESTVDPIPFVKNKVMESIRFTLRVTSGDSISVTLTDETMQLQLAEQVNTRRKLDLDSLKELQQELAEESDDERRKQIQSEIEELRITAPTFIKTEDRISGAEAAVRDIKHQLLRKQMES